MTTRATSPRALFARCSGHAWGWGSQAGRRKVKRDAPARTGACTARPLDLRAPTERTLAQPPRDGRRTGGRRWGGGDPPAGKPRVPLPAAHGPSFSPHLLSQPCEPRLIMAGFSLWRGAARGVVIGCG